MEVIEANAKSTHLSSGFAGLVTINPDGSSPFDIALGAYNSPSYSPDGDFIAFHGTFSGVDLLRIDSDGSNLTQLFSLSTNVLQPDWGIFPDTAPSPPTEPNLEAGSDSGTSSVDNLTNDDTPSFTVTADLGSTVSIFAGATLISSGTDIGTGSPQSIATDVTALADGTFSITAQATNAGGTTASLTGLSVTFDRTLGTPVGQGFLGLTLPAHSGHINFADNAAGFFASVQIGASPDYNAGDTLEILIAGASFPSPDPLTENVIVLSLAQVTGGQFINFNIEPDDFAITSGGNFAEGAAGLTIRATDPAGNVRTSTTIDEIGQSLRGMFGFGLEERKRGFSGF